MNKFNNLKSIILPSKRINLFTISILFLGIIFGAIFINIIGINDKTLVIDKIKLFISNINTNNINYLTIFKNSIGINLTYIILIFLLGLTIIGVFIGVILLFIKSFIFSFSISSFIITYGVKGILLSFVYLIFGELLNIIVIYILSVYSISFTFKLIKLIFKNDGKDMRKFLKNYFLIFILCLIMSILSSLSETFILPAIIKLIINLYI